MTHITFIFEKETLLFFFLKLAYLLIIGALYIGHKKQSHKATIGHSLVYHFAHSKLPKWKHAKSPKSLL